MRAPSFPIPPGARSARRWLAAVALTAGVRADDDFVTRVEPLLEKRCYECHSHAAGKMKGGLTLDSRSGWAEGGDNGPAVVPGKPEESLLLRMVRWTDEDHRMPPKEALPAGEVATLEDWIRRGAPDPRAIRPETTPDDDWWSLRPLTRPEVPAGGHPVDAFLDATRRAAGLTASPPAEARVLARRLHIDLTGLPPTPEEVDAFAADPDPLAYDRLVDRLLASRAYGERWARHWLDAVHFADSHGFEHDVLRPNAWRYRDYVVDSLNRDTPWARFVREQIAADVFFPAEPRLTAALGFLGAGPYDSSAAGTAVKSFEYLDRDDLVTQTLSALVSTTANCARCHAHKFDPISQEDYFALQAVFAGIGKGDIAYDEDAEVAARRARWTALGDAARRGDATVLGRPENQSLAAACEAEQGPPPAWNVLRPDVFLSSEGAVLRRLADDSLLASGPRADKDTTTVTASPEPGEYNALRLDLLPDDSLPARGPGRADNGNLHVSEVEAHLFRAGAESPEKIAFRSVSADFDQTAYESAKAIDGDRASSWAIHPQVGRPHHAVFVLAAPLRAAAGDRLVVTLRQWQGGFHLLGRFRLALGQTGARAPLALGTAVEEAWRTPAGTRSPEQTLALAAHLLRARADAELAALPPRSLVWAAGRSAVNERGTVTFSEPRPIHLLRRGDLDKPGAAVPPGALTAVRALPARFALADARDESARRAALADWIAHRDNPLTWRSAVNRVWHHHFGRGICDTPGDFGRMGGAPSHPELLDWLAAWFRDEAGGSRKALHRLLVTSAAYRQSSASRADAAAIDPDNRLLWRMHRSRLDADSLRDAVLAVSGALEPATGGPGIQHFKTSPGPQATPVLDYTAFDWNSPGAGRRSIHRVVWRGIADPFMEAVDFPDMGLLTPVRGFSASALQALTLFNNDFMLHHAARLAARASAGGASPADSVRALFRLALLREPTAQETAGFTALSAAHGLPAASRVLLNSNEFLFVD